MPNLIEHSYPLRREKVARLMTQQGWTIPSLAKAAGVDKSSIKRLFQGCRLRMSTIAPVANALGKTPDALIDRRLHQSESADHTASASIDDTSNAAPITNGPSESVADAPVHQLQYACFRIDVGLNVPYSSFKERADIPKIFGQISETIDQMGGLVVEYVGPSNSVRIVFLATRKEDVDRFFAAFREGKFDSLQMTHARILADDVEIEGDDIGHPSDSLETKDPSDSPSPSSSTDIAEETQSLESDEPLDESESSSEMSADDLAALKAAAAGAAAGAIIGSAFPVVGTVVGGFLGGILGGLIMKNIQATSKSPSDDERGARPRK